MFKAMKKTVIAGAVVAVGMAVSGGASAQGPSSITPAGPIAINGYVSVNNTAKGGNFTDFRCKVEGWGFITNATPATVRIDFLRPLNESSGQIPRGCHGVDITFPMTVTLGAMPTGAGLPLLTTTNVTVSNVVFQAPPQPGCGTGAPGTITTGGGGTVSWEESNPAFPFAGSQFDNTHTRLVFNNAVINEGGANNCLISGAIKFSRWTSIHAQP